MGYKPMTGLRISVAKVDCYLSHGKRGLMQSSFIYINLIYIYSFLIDVRPIYTVDNLY